MPISIRPDINPGTQPPPGIPWGPAYVQPPVYGYQAPVAPPVPAATVASGGNPDAGNVYK